MLLWLTPLFVILYGIVAGYCLRNYLRIPWVTRDNPAVPLFILFIVMLFACAVLAALHLDVWAEQTAIICYCSLAIGTLFEMFGTYATRKT